MGRPFVSFPTLISDSCWTASSILWPNCESRMPGILESAIACLACPSSSGRAISNVLMSFGSSLEVKRILYPSNAGRQLFSPAARCVSTSCCMTARRTPLEEISPSPLEGVSLMVTCAEKAGSWWLYYPIERKNPGIHGFIVHSPAPSACDSNVASYHDCIAVIVFLNNKKLQTCKLLNFLSKRIWQQVL